MGKVIKILEVYKGTGHTPQKCITLVPLLEGILSAVPIEAFAGKAFSMTWTWYGSENYWALLTQLSWTRLVGWWWECWWVGTLPSLLSPMMCGLGVWQGAMLIVGMGAAARDRPNTWKQFIIVSLFPRRLI